MLIGALLFESFFERVFIYLIHALLSMRHPVAAAARCRCLEIDHWLLVTYLWSSVSGYPKRREQMAARKA